MNCGIYALITIAAFVALIVWGIYDATVYDNKVKADWEARKKWLEDLDSRGL